MEESAQGEELRSPSPPPSPKELREMARSCRLEGDGLSAAVVRQQNVFSIIVADPRKQPEDAFDAGFLVRIHGKGEMLRAKITDNGDGTYTVKYTPNSTRARD